MFVAAGQSTMMKLLVMFEKPRVPKSYFPVALVPPAKILVGKIPMQQKFLVSNLPEKAAPRQITHHI